MLVTFLLRNCAAPILKQNIDIERIHAPVAVQIGRALIITTRPPLSGKGHEIKRPDAAVAVDVAEAGKDELERAHIDD